MGDRCSVELICHRHDAKRFEDAGFVPAEWGEQPDHLARMFEEQANYGAKSDLEILAGNGVFFLGASGAGNEYSASLFASDGKCFVAVNSLSDSIGSKPVAEIDDNGNADPATLKSIGRFYTALKTAKKKLRVF